MKTIGLKIPLGYRLVIFVTLTISWFTGVGFFVLDRFFEIEGEFGTEKHPFLTPALTIHGASAFLMMIWFGSLLSAHVPMGWRTRRLRFWGVSIVVGFSAQTLTAYLLYYLSNEAAREVVQWVHLIVGIVLPAVIVGHVLAGRLGRQ
jgi:hypothetical protein